MKKLIFDCLCMCLVMAGVLLAGCECEKPLWPWANLTGFVIFAIGVLIFRWRSKHEAFTGFYNRRDNQEYGSGISGNHVRKDHLAA